MDWHDYFRDIKVLLAILMMAVLILWYFTRDQSVFGMAKEFGTAIIALATQAAVTRNKAGNSNGSPPDK